MARFNRGYLLNRFHNLVDLQVGSDKTPTTIKDDIQPVVSLNPTITDKVFYKTETATSESTIYTTPTDKDFYITFANLAITKNVTNDNIVVVIRAYVDGIYRTILAINSQTLTVHSFAVTQAFIYPLKVDRGTNITILGAFAAGAISKAATVGGFILE